MSTKRLIIAVLCAAMLFSAATAAGYAEEGAQAFDIEVFRKDPAYDVAVSGNSEVSISMIVTDNAEGKELKLADSDNKEKIDARFEINGSKDRPYVLQLIIEETAVDKLNPQSIMFSTCEHSYTFKPVIEISADGKSCSLTMNLASENALQMLTELSTDVADGYFSILDASGYKHGSVTVLAPESIQDMYDKYAESGGFEQDLTTAARETPCDIMETIMIENGEALSEEWNAYVESSKTAVTVNPGPGRVTEGGSLTFNAMAKNFSYITWKLASPDGGTTYEIKAATNYFQGLSVSNTESPQITLYNCPYSLNGWALYAEFTGMSGTVQTDKAYITVDKAQMIQITASPSSGYFTSVTNRVYIDGQYGQRIRYEIYRNGECIRTGEINAGDCVWIEGINGQKCNVTLYAYDVNNRNINSISCTYTVDCIQYTNESPWVYSAYENVNW